MLILIWCVKNSKHYFIIHVRLLNKLLLIINIWRTDYSTENTIQPAYHNMHTTPAISMSIAGTIYFLG